jgi:hypothetical protein
LSENHQEFVSLALKKDVDEVIARINKNTTISKEMKEFYLKNISRFAPVYFGAKKVWVDDPSFNCVNYWKNEVLFQKLKRYLDAGAMIAVTGDLQDPLFPVRISIIDESNVRSGAFSPFLQYTLDPSVLRPDVIIYTHQCSSSFNPATARHDLTWTYGWCPFNPNPFFSDRKETFSDSVFVHSIITAARDGNVESIRDILAHEKTPLSDAIRGWAIAEACVRRHIDVVKELLKNGPISPEDRGHLLIDTLSEGDEELAQLLIDGSITQEDRGRALIATFSRISGHKCTLQILDSGPISPEDKFAALVSMCEQGLAYPDLLKAAVHYRLLAECKEFLSKDQIKLIFDAGISSRAYNTDVQFMQKLYECFIL